MAMLIRLGILVFVVKTLLIVDAVERNKFKTCDQSNFCQRCRKMETGKTPYEILMPTFNHKDSMLSVDLFNKDTGVHYTLNLTALKHNTFRLKINEKHPLKPRYEVPHVLKSEPETNKLDLIKKTSEHIIVANGDGKAVLQANPFKLDLYYKDVLFISANARGLMKFEHLRQKPLKSEEKEQNEQNEQNENVPDEKYPGDGADSIPGAWEENFGKFHDTKPNGPSAVAMDFSFVGADYAYGIPEHADSFALKSTESTDPYRLYNLDVFEYEINERMALYGAVPVLYAHGQDRTSGVFWLNAAETWVDIISSADKNVVESIVNFVSGSKKPSQVDAHFMSESGIIDTFFMLGPKPLDTFKQFTALTGTAPLPQVFALGYHQSRWNYNDQDEVTQIVGKFDIHDLPMDVIWLDIEYTDKKKYFTWDPDKFSKPLEMIKNLTSLRRKLVVIIDPHIKRDDHYFLHNDATNNGYYVKTKDGKDYEGWCWPGSSSYLDVFDPKVREYYKSRYSFENFQGTTENVYIWNDMNEPSVFDGPEITMPKDLMHHGNWEHRDVHNIYGFMHTMSTYDALYERSKGTLRPFILTRSHFAGSQRHAAVWTGDNMGEWSHLRISYAMCLSLAVSGISFCGADVGGFFKYPNDELFTRWNQAGAWLPFFRQHSHIHTQRREPWTYTQNTTQMVRESLRMRYSYLPLWYTLFREHEVDGTPVIRPLWAHYPTESKTFSIDDHLLVGDSILVRPVFESMVTEVSVYLPGENKVTWYDVTTMHPYKGSGFITLPVTIHVCPVFQKSGSIIPRKMRIRRSTPPMKDDPYTLIVIADDNNTARGTLYIDDESSFEYRDGKYLYLQLMLEKLAITSKFINKSPSYQTESWLERIDIANPPADIKSARLTSSSKSNVVLEATYNVNNNILIIRKPGVNMGEEWTIELIR